MIPLIVAVPCWIITVVLITYYIAFKFIESQVNIESFRKDDILILPILIIGLCSVAIVSLISLISLIQWLRFGVGE